MIALAADHAGYPLKEEIKKHLLERGFDVKDFGTDSDKSVDYAVFADESSASIFNFGTPLQSNYAFILVIILGYRNSYRIFGQTVLDIFAPLNHEHPAHIEIIKKSG